MKDAALRQLFEDMRNENAAAHAETRRHVAEVLGAHREEFDKRFTHIDDMFTHVEDRFTRIDDRFTHIDDRFTHIEDRFTETQRHFDERLAEVRRYVDEKFAEARHQFGIVAENLRDEIRAVADAIAMTEQRSDRRSAELRGDVDTLASTQTVMQVAHSKLERRVSALERSRK